MRSRFYLLNISACGPGKFSARKHVEVKMLYGLSCAVAAVGNYSEAVSHIHFLGKLCDDLENVSHYCGIFWGYLSRRGDMLLGDNKEMHGSSGSYVIECIAKLVLIYLC